MLYSYDSVNPLLRFLSEVKVEYPLPMMYSRRRFKCEVSLSPTAIQISLGLTDLIPVTTNYWNNSRLRRLMLV